MSNWVRVALSVGWIAFSVTPAFGQSFQVRSRVADFWSAPAIDLTSDFASSRLARSTSSLGMHPAVARGVTIGMVVGLAAGIAYGAAMKCEGMACLAKPVGMAFISVAFSLAGAMIGGTIGWIASGRPEHPLGRSALPGQFHLGLTVGL